MVLVAHSIGGTKLALMVIAVCALRKHRLTNDPARVPSDHPDIPADLFGQSSWCELIYCCLLMLF